MTRLEFNVRTAAPPPAPRAKGKAKAKAPPPRMPPKPMGGVARASAIALPFAGSLSDLVVDPLHAGAIARLAGWTEPPGYFVVAAGTGAVARTSLLPRSPVSLGETTVTRTEVASHDGARVPLTIVAPRALARDGRAPILIDVYGAYGYPYEPRFRPWLKAWLERGGVFAVAHVRGGGEHGREWHLAGRRSARPTAGAT
jgi:prolyl oligopeptidase